MGRRPLYVIGFPNQDDTADFAELKDVFQNTFDVKRVQPGYLTRVVMRHADRIEIGHDCSTLRGNSGSPIIDLETHEVLGLHMRGSREGAGQPAFNQGIGLWVLPEGPRGAGLRARPRSRRQQLITARNSVAARSAGGGGSPSRIPCNAVFDRFAKPIRRAHYTGASEFRSRPRSHPCCKSELGQANQDPSL